MGLLGVNLVAVNAGNAICAVAAHLPFGQGAGVTIAAQFVGSSDGHTLPGMLGPVGAVAGLAGNAGQHKLAGGGIVSGGVAGKTFAGLLHLMQICLKNGVKQSPGVGGIGPHLKFGGVTFAATLRALVLAPGGGQAAAGIIYQRGIDGHSQQG